MLNSVQSKVSSYQWPTLIENDNDDDDDDDDE